MRISVTPRCAPLSALSRLCHPIASSHKLLTTYGGTDGRETVAEG
jgi:hypothetical protein